ncbi:sensor histidine kinase [Spirosoma sp. SC4-14]|uniref:sensor histidine kinase n=1 Tax=Spirosoma sp. SC4-14 TaxID=3128900 RepID=UPI0030D4306F
MQELAGEVQIVIIATGFLLLVTLAPILFVLMHQRQYHRYLSEKEEIRNEYQRELLQSQIEIQNQTLQQVGQDLHDNIGQLLTVALMRLNALEDEVAGNDAQRSVNQVRELVKTIIDDVRTLGKTLDHDTVRRFGLLSSLKLELDRIQRIARMQTSLTIQGEPYPLGEKIEIVLLRMAQELLNNALKHARAHKLVVDVDYRSDVFCLTIADDGQGFDLEKVMARSVDESGAGLTNLNRRISLLKGTCSISSLPGKGSRIEIKLARYQTEVFNE